MTEIPSTMEAIAQAFIQPQVIFGYVAFLIVIFLVNVVLFTRRFITVRKGVTGGIRAVADIDSEEAFTSRFEQVDQILEANVILQETWSEFKESLIFPTEPGRSIQNSRDTEEYFHPGSIIERHLTVRYYNSVPNILTGLGILGTFIGLAAGIMVAQASLGADDLGEVQDALGGLLGGASLAFITSIAGLFLSIVFLGIERTSLGRLHENLRLFVRRLDSLLARITPERLLTDQLSELKDQSRQLKAFNDDLAFSIASALDERLSERLTPALNRLIASVHELRDRQQASSEETIRALVVEFREAMSGATGTEFERISDTLTRLDDAMSRSADKLSQREDSLQRTVQELVEKLGTTLAQNSERMRADVSTGVEEMLAAVKSSVAQLTEVLSSAQSEAALHIKYAGESFSDEVVRSSEGLGAQIHTLQGHVEGVTELAASVEEAATRLTDASKGTEQIVRRLEELENVLRTAATEIGQGSRFTREAANAVQSATSRVHDAVKELRESQEEATRSWVEYRSRFEGLDESLKGVFHQIDTGLNQYTDRVAQFHRGMDENLSSAVETMGGAVRNLEEVLEDFLDGASPR